MQLMLSLPGVQLCYWWAVLLQQAAHHCNTAAAAQLQLPAAQLQLAWARPWLVRARRARPAAPTIASLPIPSPADGWENSTFFPFMF